MVQTFLQDTYILWIILLILSHQPLLIDQLVRIAQLYLFLISQGNMTLYLNCLTYNVPNFRTENNAVNVY